MMKVPLNTFEKPAVAPSGIYLRDGGEMGNRVRNINWNSTALGTPDKWPQSLLLALSITLHAKFPMFLFWSDEHICFYNDAFMPIMEENGKHPNALASKGKDVWAELWNDSKPVIDKMMLNDETAWSDTQQLTFFKNGINENVNRIFSYSPIIGDTGTIDGVIVTCVEKPHNPNVSIHDQTGIDKLRKIFAQAPVALSLLMGSNFVVEIANELSLKNWNIKPEDVIGKPLFEVLPEVQNHGFEEILLRVYETGETYSATEMEVPIVRNGSLQTAYFSFVYEPYRDQYGNVVGIMAASNEVTNEVLIHKQKQANAQEVRALVESAPFPIGVFTGREMRITLANQSILDTWGKGYNVIGKLYRDILPELENQKIFEQLDEVFTTCKPFHAKDQRVDLEIDGVIKTCYFNYSFTPLFDGEGNIYGVMNTAADVTDLNLARKKIQHSEAELRNMILQAPVAMAIFKGKNYTVDIVNDRMLYLWGKSYVQSINKPIFEAVPESKHQGFETILENIMTTGNGVRLEAVPVTLNRVSQSELLYVNLMYEPIKEPSGEVSGIIVAGVEVTEQVVAQKKVEEAEAKARLAINSAGLAVYELDYLTGDLVGDERFNEIFGFDVNVSRAQYASRIHPDDLQLRNEAHAQSLKTGQLWYEARLIIDENITRWISVTGTIVFDDNQKPLKLIGVVQDVTNHVTTHRRIEESERNFRNMILQAPVAMCIFRGPKFVVEVANNYMYALWGRGEEEVLNKPIFEGLPESRKQGLETLIENVYKTGQPFFANEMLVNLPRKGTIESFYLNFVYEPIRDGEGSITGILAVAIDVSIQVKARKKIELSEERARLAVESAELGVYELDMTTDEMLTDKRYKEIFGVKGNATREESVRVIHPDDMEIRLRAQNMALETGKLDYECRLLFGDGLQKWVKIKGKVLFDDHKTPLRLLGVVQDITQEKQFSDALEQKVQERTKELAEANLLLQQSNIELNQFAYIASHDLQEPLRKVRTFTELMQLSLREVSEKTLGYIGKIQSSTARMQDLINDVLKFSQLSKEKEKFQQVDLNNILQHVISDYELLIEQKGAKIMSENLPQIEAIPLQMSQLFTNLISNALKFSSDKRALEIVITSRHATNDELTIHAELNPAIIHYVIEVKDNGIGFNQEHAHQIFTMFQRLHGRMEYAGTGIGLAMCKKIASNHHGVIFAHSILDEGSSFTMLFPGSQKRI